MRAVLILAAALFALPAATLAAAPAAAPAATAPSGSAAAVATTATTAGTVSVAVAANFTAPLDEIGKAFEAATGNHLQVSAGSTGKLAAQIENGAPFEVLLAADADRPAQLEKKGETVAGSRFTYARGRLVLWSPDPRLVDPDGKVLASAGFHHLAVANPDLAPYGAAARQTLTKLGVLQAITPRLVQGEDIGQTYQFVASGAAELGFVALSQVRAGSAPKSAGGAGQPVGSMWIVPDDDYAPIEQQAVLLKKGAQSPAAAAFLAFLKSDKARAIIERSGYRLP